MHDEGSVPVLDRGSAPRELRRSLPSAPEGTALRGFVHSTESGSAVDGPGMRFLVFLSGCAFRCLYCHNPDTWRGDAGTERSVADVADEVGRFVPWIRRSGGITVSGGEPLRQARFTEGLLREVKARYGLHTALETTGYLIPRLPDSWFDPVDLVLLDVKHIDDAAHRAITGGFPAAPVLEGGRRLGRLGVDVWLRYVVTPGLTDKLDAAERLADYAASIPTLRRVELLPFHQLGRDKWHKLGLDYPLEGAESPDPELVESLRRPFRERGLETC